MAVPRQISCLLSALTTSSSSVPCWYSPVTGTPTWPVAIQFIDVGNRYLVFNRYMVGHQKVRLSGIPHITFPLELLFDQSFYPGFRETAVVDFRIAGFDFGRW